MVKLDSVITTAFLSNYLLTVYPPKFLSLSRTIITTSFVCLQDLSFSATEDDKASSLLNKIKGMGI